MGDEVGRKEQGRRAGPSRDDQGRWALTGTSLGQASWRALRRDRHHSWPRTHRGPAQAQRGTGCTGRPLYWPSALLQPPGSVAFSWLISPFWLTESSTPRPWGSQLYNKTNDVQGQHVANYVHVVSMYLHGERGDTARRDVLFVVYGLCRNFRRLRAERRVGIAN